MTQATEAAQIQEALSALPEDERIVRADFWIDLRPSGLQAACPACGALTLARYARGQQRRHWYILHCSDVRMVKAI